MADSSLGITLADLRSEVVTQWKGNVDYDDLTANEKAFVDRVVASGLRRFYYPEILPGENQAHVWGFLTPTASLVLNGPYTTGTIAISGTTVTLSGGTWPTWAASADLIVGGTAYQIASRDSDTQLTIGTSATVAAGTAYSLNRYVYALHGAEPRTYSAGTITAANDPTVTLSGGVWPEWVVGATLTYASSVNPDPPNQEVPGGSVTVVSRTSDTEIEVSSNVLAVGATYSLLESETEDNAVDDFAFIIGTIAFVPYANHCLPAMSNVGPQRLQELRQRSPSLYGVPEVFALRSLRKAASGGTHWALEIYPASDEDRTVRFRYALNPNDLADASSKPHGGALHAETIIAACLAALESKDGIAGPWTEEFKTLLRRSVLADRKQYGATNLGRNLDLSDMTPDQYLDDNGRRVLGGPGTTVTLHF